MRGDLEEELAALRADWQTAYAAEAERESFRRIGECGFDF